MIVFYTETAFWGAAFHQHPQIWIAHSARRNGVYNLELDVQNCTKWVQNYDLVLYVETAFGAVAVCHQPPKFELSIAQEGVVYKIWDSVYKIWDSVYKIVQNEYKIMIQFFMFKLHLGGCMSPSPQIWIADRARRKGVQNIGLSVQNCTKWVQNYDILFVLQIRLGRVVTCTYEYGLLQKLIVSVINRFLLNTKTDCLSNHTDSVDWQTGCLDSLTYRLYVLANSLDNHTDCQLRWLHSQWSHTVSNR